MTKLDLDSHYARQVEEQQEEEMMPRPYTDAEWVAVEAIDRAIRDTKWAVNRNNNPLTDEERKELRLALTVAEDLLESYVDPHRGLAPQESE